MARRAVSFEDYERHYASPAEEHKQQHQDTADSGSRYSIDSLIHHSVAADDSVMGDSNRYMQQSSSSISSSGKPYHQGHSGLTPHVAYQLDSISDVAKSIFLANSLIEAVESDFAVASAAWASRFKQLEEEKEEYKNFCDAELDRALAAAKAVTVAKEISDAKVRDLKRLLEAYDKDFKVLKDEYEVNKFDDTQKLTQLEEEIRELTFNYDSVCRDLSDQLDTERFLNGRILEITSDYENERLQAHRTFEIEKSSIIAAKDSELSRVTSDMQEQLDDKEAEIARWGERVGELDVTIAAYECERLSMLQRLADKDASIESMSQQLSRAEAEIELMNARRENEEIQIRDQTKRQFLDQLQAIDSVNAVLADKLKIKGAVEEALRDTVSYLENNVKKLEKKLSESEEARKLIGDNCNDMQVIMNSRSQPNSPMKPASGSSSDSVAFRDEDSSTVSSSIGGRAFITECPTPSESKEQIEQLRSAFIETLAQLDASQQQCESALQSLQKTEVVETELRGIIDEYGNIVKQQKSDFHQQNESLKMLLSAQSDREYSSQQRHNDECERYALQINELSARLSSLEQHCSDLERGVFEGAAVTSLEKQRDAIIGEYAALKVLFDASQHELREADAFMPRYDEAINSLRAKAAHVEELEDKVRLGKAVVDDMLATIEQKDVRVKVLEAALDKDTLLLLQQAGSAPTIESSAKQATAAELSTALTLAKIELAAAREAHEELSRQLAAVTETHAMYKSSGFTKVQEEVDTKIAILTKKFDEESERQLQTQRQMLSDKEAFLKTIKSMNMRIEAQMKEIAELKSNKN